MKAYMLVLQQQRDEALHQLKCRDATIRKLQIQLQQAENRIQEGQVREKLGMLATPTPTPTPTTGWLAVNQ
jgi:hypothetical protein